MPLPTPSPSRPVIGLPLTDREREVLYLVCRDGLKRETAAVRLGVNRRTLDRRLTAAFRKLGVSSAGEAGFLLGQAEWQGR